ncbi:hypothetical protein C8J56DRAFT_925748 [Mycena floridula]|nr:hypothetical protein C8J56DRAFT_925748 [Mycena floridula]
MTIQMIVAIVSGVVALILALALLWIVRRHRSKSQQSLAESARSDDSDASFLSMSRGTVQPLHRTSNRTVSGNKPSDVQPQPRNFLSKPRPLSDLSILQPRPLSISHPSPLKHQPPKPASITINEPEPKAPVPKALVGSAVQKLKAVDSDLKRANSVKSADSASIYSVASAAPELHDRVLYNRLFQPLKLDTIPASPTSPSFQRDSRDSGVVQRREPIIREELAPETYHRRLRDSDEPLLSPSPLGRLITPLSPSHSRPNSSHYLRMSVHDTVTVTAPAIPPRSALRNLTRS